MPEPFDRAAYEQAVDAARAAVAVGWPGPYEPPTREAALYDALAALLASSPSPEQVVQGMLVLEVTSSPFLCSLTVERGERWEATVTLSDDSIEEAATGEGETLLEAFRSLSVDLRALRATGGGAR